MRGWRACSYQRGGMVILGAHGAGEVRQASERRGSARIELVMSGRAYFQTLDPRLAGPSPSFAVLHAHHHHDDRSNLPTVGRGGRHGREHVDTTMAQPFPYTYYACDCFDSNTTTAKRTSQTVAGADDDEDGSTFDPRHPRSNYALYPLEHLLTASRSAARAASSRRRSTGTARAVCSRSRAPS
jgi:hypothetical protein